MQLDEAKTAVIYEAMRRRPEVQQAWLNGKFLFHDNGWQTLTGFVVNYLPQPGLIPTGAHHHNDHRDRR